MTLPRREFLQLAAGLVALPAAARHARAQATDYPNKPVRIITHSAPGGAPDALLRIVGDRLSQMWGRQVITLNHPGAGGAVAAREAAKAVPDGYPPLAGALSARAIKALAIGATKRLPDFPDLPTVAETLPGFSPGGWLALVAPVGTPDAIVHKLSADLGAAVTDPATRTKLETTGNYPNPMTPAELLAFIQAEQQMWKPVPE